MVCRRVSRLAMVYFDLVDFRCGDAAGGLLYSWFQTQGHGLAYAKTAGKTIDC
jgi:hypothetical protein